jgi:hypothetical protein
MIIELLKRLDEFPGASNRSRCFTHILNLAAKSIIRQFNLPKSEATVALDEAAKELAKLAAKLEHEELMSSGSPGENEEDEDDSDGWVDEKALLSDEEQERLNKSVKPVRLMLVKVSLPTSFLGGLVNHKWQPEPLPHYQLRKLAYALKNSTTILLPKWFSVLEDLKLAKRMMPCDVSTRWNSTFDMLDFTLQYQTALQAISGNLDLDLRQYELDREEWKNAQQLRDILKVCYIFVLFMTHLSLFKGLQGRNHVFLTRTAKYRPCYPINGLSRPTAHFKCPHREVLQVHQSRNYPWKEDAQSVL